MKISKTEFQSTDSIKHKTITNRPLLILVLVFIFGIIASVIIEPGLFFILSLSLFFWIMALAGLFLGWRETRWFLLMLSFLLGLFCGGLSVKGIDYSLLEYKDRYVTLEGTVIRAPEYRQDSVEYVLQVEKIYINNQEMAGSGRVLLRLNGTPGWITYGDVLRVRGFLRLPLTTGNPGAFNYGEFLKRRGIVATIYTGDDSITKLEDSTPGPMGLAVHLREKMMALARDTLSPVHAAMLNGMMFGARGEIPKELQEAFSESGLAHVLCVSGLHVGLILGGLLIITGALGISKLRVPLLLAPLLIFYAAMTGFGPAVVRAVIMALLLIWAHYLGRERDWPTTMAFAALVILLVNPLQLYEVGFQLSFVATWGILYLVPFLKKKLEPVAFLPGWVSSVLLVTVAAQLATLPIIIEYFNLVSFVSILANVLVVPALGIILFMGFIVGLVGLVTPLLAEYLNLGTGVLLFILEWLIFRLREIPGASYYMASWPWWGVFFWYSGLVIIVEWERIKGLTPYIDHSKVIKSAIIVALCLLLVFVWAGQQGSELEIHFIDVGQGDSILVNLPGGSNMLVDAGGRRGEFESGTGVGDNVVVPYLRRLGINNLDVLVITHFHEDHAGGALAVMNYIDVQRMVVSPIAPGDSDDPNINNILNKAQVNEIPVHFAAVGSALQLDDDVSISILSPPANLLKGTRSDMNNNCLVMLLEYGNITILLTGDIEEEMQTRLVQGGNLRPVDVLQAPHHGSRYFSPSFFEQANPKVAVISVGASNAFDFPSGEIISLLEQIGALVYRTDRDGAVIIYTDGNKIKIETGR